MAGSLPPEIVIPPETPQDLKERVRPQPSALQGDQGRDGASGSTLRPDPTAAQGGARKKRSHRGGKKKRIRRQSFAAPSDDGSGLPETSQSRVDVHIQGVAIRALRVRRS
jgi:magnesium transporter